MAPQSHVLVSGGSGFVASHIISLLIAQKYAVTATVRAPAKGTEILNLHPEGKDNLTFAYVPDIAVEGAFDSAFKSAKTPFTYVIHTSSPVNFSVKDFKRDLVDPAVQGYT
jgi:nucleoside-diphosphate-sugar epimerase